MWGHLSHIWNLGINFVFKNKNIQCEHNKKSIKSNLKQFECKIHKFENLMSQVSTHVVLDNQTLSALAQHTQITWTAQIKCDEHYRVERWRLSLHYIIIQHTYIDT